MIPTSLSLRLSRSAAASLNYGDAVRAFLIGELIHDFSPDGARTYVGGSIISDDILQNAAFPDQGMPSSHLARTEKTVFWGCGIVGPGSLSAALQSSAIVLAVRGPVSAAELNLGTSVPQGDPVLLLPALYAPTPEARFDAKSVCVPRLDDTRADEDILLASGCDLVLRLAPNMDSASVKAFVGAICSSGFVMAGDADVAMTAAAYGVPFCFFGDADTEATTEWADVAGLLGIPCAFFEHLDAGSAFHRATIAPAISVPPLWPLLCAAPGFIKPTGLLKVLRYELERSTGRQYHELDEFLQQASKYGANHERMAAHANDVIRTFAAKNDRLSDRLSSTTALLESKDGECVALRSACRDALAIKTRLSDQIDHISHAKSALELQIEELEDRLTRERAKEAGDGEGSEDPVPADVAALEREKRQLVEQNDALQQQVEAIQLRLATANELARRHIDNQDAIEKRLAALTAENDRLAKLSAEFAAEQDRWGSRAGGFDDTVEALRQELAALSGEMDEQRRQADRRVQGLAMEHEEELRARNDAHRQLELDVGRLQEEMLRLIGERNDHVAEAEAQLAAAREAAEREIAALTESNGAAGHRNAELAHEMDVLRERLGAAVAESDHHRQQIASLDGELQYVRVQADQLRDQSQTLVAQHVALRDNLALTESESVAKAARADAALSRYWTLLGQSSAQLKGPSALVRLAKIGRKSKALRGHREIISQFLDGFSETELGFSRAGRKQRITQYLIGVTPDVEDFPLFNRDIYLALNPDVAAAGVDPFIHFIQNGQWESRVIHPAMDIPYYVARYPEVDKFKSSAIQHYFKFGVSKNYDPSPVFSTKWYFDHYADVKMIGINPVIHYLRYPGCQPHPDFDSDYYRRHNLDVVRHGINPLAHYTLSGQQEGRRPSAHARSIAPAAAPAAAPVAAPAQERSPPTPEPVAAPPTGGAVLHRDPVPTSLATRPIVVMMDAFYPRPDEDSGSLDQVNFIRIFQNLGFDVAFIALLNFGDPPEAGAKIAALGAHCVTTSDVSSIEEYLFLNQERISVLFLSRVHFGGAWIERGRAFCPGAQIVFNTVDLHHVREEREAALRGDAESAMRSQETKRLEYGCITAADVSIVVSEHEQVRLAADLPTSRVVVVPLMREIGRTSFPDWEHRSNLAFVGGFQHQPNIDAVNYFLDDIWPRVLARRPELVFHVIGSHMPAAMTERNAPNVEWVGHVPELEPWLDGLRLTVAPLRYGAGAKGKVVSSLLNGVPCVATSIAAEGMGLRIGDDIVACDSSEDFADAIVRVHDDAEVWRRLSDHGFATLSRTHSIEYAQKCLESVLVHNATNERV